MSCSSTAEAGGWPTTFSDVGAAIDEVPDILLTHRQLAGGRVIVVGHSAGGTLAVRARARSHIHQTATKTSPYPAGGTLFAVRNRLSQHRLSQYSFHPTEVIAIAAPLDLVDRSQSETDSDVVRELLGGTPDRVPANYVAADPIRNIDPSLRVTVVNGTNDHLVPLEQASAYVNVARAQGQDATLVPIASASHLSPVTPGKTGYPEVSRIIFDAATGHDRQP